MGKQGPTSKLERQQARERRKQLGRLRELIVLPRTLKRYNLAIARWFVWVHALCLVFPQSPHQLDALVSNYVEHLWEGGESVGWAQDVISGLQYHFSFMKRQFTDAWRLVAAWHRQELPHRASPLPVLGMMGMSGACILMGMTDVAIAISFGFL